jgi:hypothetical protein
MQEVRRISMDLSRSKLVHVLTDGTLRISHLGQGLSLIHPDGTTHKLGPYPALSGGAELIPNGIAPLPNGSFLIANIGERGGIWRLLPDGELTPFPMDVDGVFLAVANVVMVEVPGRVFFVDKGGGCILADDICFANKCWLTLNGTGLMVSETFSGRAARFDLSSDGISGRRTLAQFGRREFPDELRYASDGSLWVTCIVANRLWRIAFGAASNSSSRIATTPTLTASKRPSRRGGLGANISTNAATAASETSPASTSLTTGIRAFSTPCAEAQCSAPRSNNKADTRHDTTNYRLCGPRRHGRPDLRQYGA